MKKIYVVFTKNVGYVICFIYKRLFFVLIFNNFAGAKKSGKKVKSGL